TMSSICKLGISLRKRFKKYVLLKAPLYSSRPKRQCLPKNFQVPPYVKASAVSLKLKAVLLYPSRSNTNTALGPHSVPPLIMRVKCTPKNGNLGFGTG